MSGHMHVSLCEGKRVRDPRTGVYLEMGREYKVEKNQFWLRRVESKDVEISKKTESVKSSSKKKKRSSSKKAKESGE